MEDNAVESISHEVIQAGAPAERLQLEELLRRVLTMELKIQTIMDENIRRNAELQQTKMESELRLLALEARVSQIQSQVLQLQNIQNAVMSSGSSVTPQRKHSA